MIHAACIFLAALGGTGNSPRSASPVVFHVEVGGGDAQPGTRARPFASLRRALEAARDARRDGIRPVTIELGSGTHYLEETVVLTAGDSGTKSSPLVIRAAAGARPLVSGGRRLSLRWEPDAGGILRARVPPGLEFDQLFVNGERQHMARYPNFDPGVRHWNGYARDAFSKERVARWADPAGGYIHAMHRNMWGDFHYLIRGKKPDGSLDYVGGWQNNRRYGMHGTYRMVENIFEELDAPGEWYLDSKKGLLYFYPPSGTDMEEAVVESVHLRHLIELRGTRQEPVRYVRLRGLTFEHAARTFMDNKEPLLRSDWTIYRGGALFFDGAEDCTVEDCEFDQVGGNAVFVSRYARRIAVRGCHIHHAGANGVAFVGDPGAVRNPLFEYSQRQSYTDLDTESGPKTEDFPGNCTVEDCLVYLTGRVEKQTAGVQISMSSGITVRHCSIYDVPRAGINISDGTWGGHLIEYCDVFDTVRETGDHGSFNSWGRDRYWHLKDIDLNKDAVWETHEKLPLLDAAAPVILRRNRWRCDHGWDIDLDDGSSNYILVDNLCLHGGIKLREGFYRVCKNNIMADNTFHPHVWYRHSQDVFQSNIVFAPYRPIRMPRPWGRSVDFNFLHRPGAETSAATMLAGKSGRDEHSLTGDARFVDPGRGDYRLKPDSDAARVCAFRNFPMDSFGVVKPSLREIARTPRLPAGGSAPKAEPGAGGAHGEGKPREWMGATVRSVTGPGDRSAYGLEGEYGAIVLDVPEGSAAHGIGLKKDDVIVRINGKEVRNTGDLKAMKAGTRAALEIVRGQVSRELDIVTPAERLR